jgi:hypothetical protein
MNWEIRDETGVIHFGTEEEMRIAWAVLTGDTAFLADRFPNQMDIIPEMEKYLCQWEGDLELVEIHKVKYAP